MVRLYEMVLTMPDKMIDGKVYNAGLDNASVSELAEIVKSVVETDNEVGGKIELDKVPTNDDRSYRVSSKKIARELGFRPQKTIEDAVRDLVSAMKEGKLKDTMNDIRYYNIKTMQAINLK
jgi:nucleoside-diphosphate-sugar epimerase